MAQGHRERQIERTAAERQRVKRARRAASSAEKRALAAAEADAAAPDGGAPIASMAPVVVSDSESDSEEVTRAPARKRSVLANHRRFLRRRQENVIDQALVDAKATVERETAAIQRRRDGAPERTESSYALGRFSRKH